MLKMFKNKKAQNTAEYAILIALVVGGIIAMQTYVQRAMQGRFRDASTFLAANTSVFGTNTQYEAYYTNTTSTNDRNATDVATDKGKTSDATSNTTRTDRQEWNGTADMW